MQEWKDADKTAAELNLMKTIDVLEGLAVRRLFELSKMHKAGTCTFVKSFLTRVTNIFMSYRL